MNEDTIIQSVLAGLLGPALIEGKDEIVDWIASKVQASYPKLFDNIMKYATDRAFYEDKDYKPSSRVKDLARKYYGPLEEDSDIAEQERDLKEAMGTNDNASENESYEAYQSREDVPEQARELWDILHNDDALKSMKRGTGDEL